MAVKVVTVAIPAGGAAGEDDVDKHGNALSLIGKMRRGPGWPSAGGFMRKKLKGYAHHNVHFVRPVNGL